MKWMLKETTKDGMYNKYRKENETVYHYVSGDHKVAFHSHPSKAFSMVKVYGLDSHLNEVVEKWIEQGLKQHKYPGGFDEAIRELED